MNEQEGGFHGSVNPINKKSRRAERAEEIKKKCPFSMRKALEYALNRPPKIREISNEIGTSIGSDGLEAIQASIAILSGKEGFAADARNLLLGCVRACNSDQIDTAKKLFDENRLPLSLDDDQRILKQMIKLYIATSRFDDATKVLEDRQDEWSRRQLAEIAFSRIFTPDRLLTADARALDGWVGELRQIAGNALKPEDINRRLFSLLKKSKPAIAVEYGQKVARANARFHQAVVGVLSDMGREQAAFELCQAVTDATQDPWHTSRLEILRFALLVPRELAARILNLDSCESDAQLDRLVSEFIGNRPERSTMTYVFDKLFSRQVRYKGNLASCLKLGHALLSSGPVKVELVKKVADLHLFAGSFTNALKALTSKHDFADLDGDSLCELNMKRESIEGMLMLLEGNLPHLRRRPNSIRSIGRRVLYLLNNSLPFESGGHATRGHGLLKGLRSSEWDTHAVTRLGYPWDAPKHRDKPVEILQVIDGVPYHRLPAENDRNNEIPLQEYIKEYAEHLVAEVLALRPQIIHAASYFLNGLAANEAGRVLGIPTIYEVRGLGEINRVSHQPDWEGSEEFLMCSSLETRACNDADAVITITDALKEELIRRGVNGEKITIIKNGVDSDRFTPRPEDEELKSSLGYTDEVIVGYIGSVVDYEGLELLVDAATILQERGLAGFRILIVGDGHALQRIKSLAAASSAANLFNFTGRVPHEDVESYYSLIHIAPLPRLSLPVTEMVSPLKPFEAMSMEKCVICSDVQALREIVQHGITGLLHRKNDAHSLADALQQAIEDRELRISLGKQAREWVQRERNWKVLSANLIRVYNDLIDAKGAN